MRKSSIVAGLFCILFLMVGKAQHSKLDSLKRIVEENNQDTTQVKATIRLASYYLRRNLDTSLEYAQKARALSEQLNYVVGRGKALGYEGLVYMDMGQTYKAEELIDQSIEILAAVEHDNVDVDLASSYSLKGHLENNKNHTDKAFEYYLKAAKICENSSDAYAKYSIPAHYNNIAILYKTKKEYEKGLHYALKALEAVREGDQLTRSVLLSTIGRFYLHLDAPEKALSHFNEALALKTAIDDKTGMISLFSAIGNLHFDQKEYDKANENYQKVSEMSNQLNYIQGKIISQYNFARLAYTQKEYIKAIQAAQKVLRFKSDSTDIEIYLQDAYKILAKSYAATGQFELAYGHQLQYEAIQDTFILQKQQENIDELATKYEVEKKERENKYLKAEQTKNETILKQRNYIVIAAIIAAILLAILAMVLSHSNRLKQSYNQQLEITVTERTQELQLANKNLEQANYELRTFNYIASHDIKEPIRNVGNYAGLIFRKLPDDLKNSLKTYFDTIKRNTTQLYTLVEDFAKYTTLSKDETIEKRLVNLNELISGVEGGLYQQILERKGQVINHGLPTISSNGSLLYTIFKNIIENGLKYNQSSVPTVEISFIEKAENYEIVVSDNGIGIDEEYYDKVFEMFKRLHHRGEYEGSGIGLAIVKLAINKLDGTVRVNSNENGSRFILELPKEN